MVKRSVNYYIISLGNCWLPNSAVPLVVVIVTDGGSSIFPERTSSCLGDARGDNGLTFDWGSGYLTKIEIAAIIQNVAAMISVLDPTNNWQELPVDVQRVVLNHTNANPAHLQEPGPNTKHELNQRNKEEE